MSLWRKTRTEVAGAWRSLRYDLDRRTGPDGTGTGTNTFGPLSPGEPATGYSDEPPRRPRPVLAIGGLAALAVAGAAGSYVVVAEGSGAIRDDKPATAWGQPYPLSGETPVPTRAVARLGRAAVPTPRRKIVTVPTSVVAVATKRPVERQPVVTSEPPVLNDPPAPTPTAPTPSGSTPSGSPSPSPSLSPTPTPTPPDDPSATPTDGAPGWPGSSESAWTGRRKRHARPY